MTNIKLKSENLKLGTGQKKIVKEDVQKILNSNIQDIADDDNFDDEAAIFLPTKDSKVVDDLRKKIAEKDKKLAEKDKELAEISCFINLLTER